MTRILLLGSGTPTPSPNRFGSSYVVQAGQDYLMFDCGPATTHKLAKMGLRSIQIDYLFFTHHHFDHNIDYPCFLLTRWDQSIGEENQLQVYGPSPTHELTERLIGEHGAFSLDWKARVGHPMSQATHIHRGGSLPRRTPHVMAKDIGPGVVCSANDWEVLAGPADHIHPFMGSLSYRINTTGHSIVISGDTRKSQRFIEFARGADTLLMMCIHHQEYLDSNPIGTGTTGTTAAASIASEAGVKRLVLVHQGFDLVSAESKGRALADIASIYQGEIVWGEELTVLE